MQFRVFCFLLFLFISLNSFSLSLKPVTLEELSSKADLILVGKCLDKNFLTSEYSGTPLTSYNFRIDKILNGEYFSENISLLLTGGIQKEKRIFSLPGLIEPEISKNYLLFLVWNPYLNGYTTVGANHGLLKIRQVPGSDWIRFNGNSYKLNDFKFLILKNR